MTGRARRAGASRLAALLGALEAQMDFGVAAIGGKDSMSGSFEKLDVPPTLVSFAVGRLPSRRGASPTSSRRAGHGWCLIAPGISTPTAFPIPRASARCSLMCATDCAGRRASARPMPSARAEWLRRRSRWRVGNGFGFRFADDVAGRFSRRSSARSSWSCASGEAGEAVGEVTDAARALHTGDRARVHGRAGGHLAEDAGERVPGGASAKGLRSAEDLSAIMQQTRVRPAAADRPPARADSRVPGHQLRDTTPPAPSSRPARSAEIAGGAQPHARRR